MASGTELYCKNLTEWRAWLGENNESATEIWLIYYKKYTGTANVRHEDAVEEALCFGWIDSVVRRIDGEKYARKFTPRKKISGWSELNKKRATKLIKQGRMKAAGLARVEEAQKNGKWHESAKYAKIIESPPEFKSALAANDKARHTFNSLAPSYRRRYVDWIVRAKTDDTRQKRVRESVSLLARGQKLGMK